jgi:signal transduction histidine kinase
MDALNTNRDPNSGARDRSIAAGFVLLATTVSLVALALVASGDARIASIAALGVLVPTVAIAVGSVERRRVAHRITDLEAELRNERDSGQQLNQLFARFTDELRAPLTAVYGLSQHLEDAGIGDGDVAEAEVLIEMVSHDATEIARTVENAATAAQIDSGTYRSNPVVVELDHRVIRIVESIGTTPLDIVVAARAATVWCDPAAIRLILLNVFHGAVNGAASTARVEVDERNGLGIISITDDRQRGHVSDDTPGDLLGTGDVLSHGIVPALVASQGGTMSSTRTLGLSHTAIRLPNATPSQLSASNGPTFIREPSRSA